MKTQNGKLNIELLTLEEREKVETLNIFEPSGLYGQFPHAAFAYAHWKEGLSRLFAEAEETLLTILAAPQFAGYRRYTEGPLGMALIAPSLDPIMEGRVTKSCCMFIWSAHERGTNNNLMLVVADDEKARKKKLYLCTAQYIYQSQDMRGGLHWYRTFSDSDRLEVDSYRLHQVLTVLANPADAWTYLRARVHSIELSRH